VRELGGDDLGAIAAGAVYVSSIRCLTQNPTLATVFCVYPTTYSQPSECVGNRNICASLLNCLA
jgi:hypothetical protein